MSEGKFATVINCMDGRTQLPVNLWMREKFGVNFVDTITEAGPIKILAEGKDGPALGSIKKRVLISVKRHGSRNIAVVAHHDCAGNPVPDEIQLEQIKAAVKTVASWNLPASLIGLWVDEGRRVHVIT